MRKTDFYIIFVVAIIAVLGALYFRTTIKDSDRKIAVVKIDGKVVEEIELSEKNNGYEKTFHSKYGYNIVEVEGGKIRVREADCPDQVDVKKGYISRVGESLICLPHRFVIEIEAENTDENNIDIMGR